MSDPVVLTPGDGIGPTVAGKNPADPTASLCSTVLMLRHLKMNDVAVRVMTAIRQTLSDAIRTRDVRGDASTTEYTEAVVARL